VQGSLNTRLAGLAAASIETHGERSTLARWGLQLPSYNADPRDVGFTSGAVELRRRLEAADAFVTSSPEHAASLPGPLKATPERWPR
jgi:NAD(P)H-dependent FMN reductase